MSRTVSRRELLLGGAGLVVGGAVGAGVVALVEQGGGAGGGGSQLEPGVAVYSGGTSYISPLVELFGDVSVGSGVFVASNTLLRAAPGRSIRIADNTNSQDNVVIHALDSSTTVANRTSLAHHAVVRDSTVGEFVFLGFRAEVLEAKIGTGAVVLHGARVLGVELPSDALVAPGATVDSQADANSLPRVDEALVQFKEEVLEVNREFAAAYVELANVATYQELTSTGPNPVTSFSRVRTMPVLGAGTQLADFARVVGGVTLGANAMVGERAALRADEGSPIVVGSDAIIGARVTLHSLKGTSLRVGDRFRVAGGSVVHGPLKVGNDVTVGSDAVVFRATIGERVQIGDRAVIAGPAEGGDELDIPSGTTIPAGGIVTRQEDLAAMAPPG